ncbi:MAG: D-aminoacyl-tRNA deacylase [Myxococcota bacterium]|nr:D-aminoacyl-tRNA deacylase [Myxococcota bacterium]
MRAVVQRVREARVEVAGETVAAMGAGLLALVGVAAGDGPDDAAWLADKLVGLRLFDDASGRMNRSLLETGGTLGLVSQFTLLGDARKGRRPSWAAAAAPVEAEPLLETRATRARDAGAPVVTGRFRATMDVALVNAGPVTLVLDSPRRGASG